MKKKILSLAMISTMVLSIFTFIPGALAVARTHHAIMATIGEPATVDPAWCYDTASATILQNVYDTLIFFDVNYSAPRDEAGKTDVFTHSLAVAGWSPDEYTYIFKIRGTGSLSHTLVSKTPIDKTKPKCTYWQEVEPGWQFNWMETDLGYLLPQWHLKSWEDNTDGELSVCDIIDMETQFPQPWPKWAGEMDTWMTKIKFHVEEVIQDVPEPGYVTMVIHEVPVLFHNGATLDGEDVEYSFERWMVQDRAGGPTWMILEPLLNTYHTELTAEFAEAIDDSVVSWQDPVTHQWYVRFNLALPFPSMIFFQTIAQSWAAILDYDWTVAQGGFTGFDVTGYDPAVWGAWNNPPVSELDNPPVMCGTGPFMLDYWIKGVEWSIIRFPEHWQQWPWWEPCQLPYPWYPEGWFNRVTTKFIPEWSTRKMMFLACDVDFCYVPRMHIPEMILNYPAPPPRKETEIYVPGIRCDPDLPTLVCSPCMFFNFDIAPTSPLLGPGFDPENPLVIAEDRIPTNFMSDIEVRKGFANCFDYDTYIREVYMGEAKRQNVCIPEPLPYFNPDQEGYLYDKAAAEEHFRAAFGGDVWANGFTMEVTYNTGNIPRMKACEMIKECIEQLNPKFHIIISEVDWPAYLTMLVSYQLTLFVIGWLADYPDPHNFVHPFMHSQGAFTDFQGYGDPHVDDLVEAGVVTPDGPGRQDIYYELQQIYHEDCISVPLAYPLGRHWEKDWIIGWYYNAIYPGNYYKHLWKGYYGDTDRDYDVDLTDLYNVLIHYCSLLPEGVNWADWTCPLCGYPLWQIDMDKNNHIGLRDLYWVLMNYGKNG